MKKVLLFPLLLSIITIATAQTAPNIIMEDITNKKYAPLHELLDEGHYIAFYMLSST